MSVSTEQSAELDRNCAILADKVWGLKLQLLSDPTSEMSDDDTLLYSAMKSLVSF